MGYAGVALLTSLENVFPTIVLELSSRAGLEMARLAPRRNSHKILVMDKEVPAAEFKARCLELMDRVRETGAEYIVTKHGRPVARLVPYVGSKRRKTMFGAMKGTVLKFERPLDPIDADYDLDRG